MPSVQELTNSLVKAVDQEGNVKDMTVVLSVVAVLEKTDITAEDLKVTRLGRVVNLVRRKVVEVDKQLSKRLKNLVKEWRNKVPNGTTPTTTPSQGSSLGITTTTTTTSASPLNPSKQIHEEAHSSGSHLSSQYAASSVDSLGTKSSSHVHDSAPQSQPSSQDSASSDSSSVPVQLLEDSGIGSLEQNSLLMPNSVGPSSPLEPGRSSTSPSFSPHISTPSPTPPSGSTLSSRPNQPVSANPARNRFMMMQKLSGVKRSGAGGGSQGSRPATTTGDSSPSHHQHQQHQDGLGESAAHPHHHHHHHANETLLVNSHTTDPHHHSTTAHSESLTSQSSSSYLQKKEQQPLQSLDGLSKGSSGSDVTAIGRTDSKLSRSDSNFSFSRQDSEFSGMLGEDDYPQSQWTAGLFTDMDFMNGSNWIPPQTPVEPSNGSSGGSMHPLPAVTIDNETPPPSPLGSCNGATSAATASGIVVDGLQSRKRPRPSSSPVEERFSPSTSSPAHKKHRTHGDKMAREHRRHHRSLIVRVSLLEGIIRLNHHHHRFLGGPSEEKKHLVGASSGGEPLTALPEAARLRGREELVVSIPLALLRAGSKSNNDVNRVAESSNINSLPQNGTPWDDRTADRSNDLVDMPHVHVASMSPPPVHKQMYNLTTLGSHDFMKASHDRTDGQNNDIDALHGKVEDVVMCTTCRRTVQPEWACPGLDGCLGCDGFWYEWTDHICSLEEEVTVMPYIYIEDDDNT